LQKNLQEFNPKALGGGEGMDGHRVGASGMRTELLPCTHDKPEVGAAFPVRVFRVSLSYHF